MSSAAETIKDRLGIVEVVGSYMKIDKAGTNYKGRCPFHNEKTPSFFVSPGRSSYYCFGCGAKGDIFTFVQEFEKVDFVGALKILAEKAGVELEQFRDGKKGELDRLRGVLEIATSFYEAELKQNAAALEYLKGRGLDDKMISGWRIGFAPNDWRKAHDHLLGKHIGQIDMEAVGLIKRADKEGGRGDTVYDRFRSRIMFPLFDPSGRVIGYSGRIFGVPESEGPKYLNSPDTALFNKSETLYGYHKAKEGIREWKYAILVEGQMDLLMCHHTGFTNAVATSGTSLTPMHLEKLKRLSDNLMLVYDADKAGLKATLRAWTSALALGMDVKVAALPQGEDPASLLLKGKDGFKQALQHSKHIIDYYIGILSKEGLPADKFKKAVEKEVLPYVAAVDSAIERSNFISRVSIQTGIYESDLREEAEKMRAKREPSGSGSAEAMKADTISYEDDNGNAHASRKAFSSYTSNDETVRRVAGLIVWLKSKGTAEDQARADKVLADVSAILSPEDSAYFKEDMERAPDELIFEAEILFQGSSKLDEDIQDLLNRLEERTLKDGLSRRMSELQIAEKKQDKQRADELLRECQDISLKLSSLNKRRKE